MPDPSKLCVYCVLTELTGAEKPEHPVPAALGASLVVSDVCDACNERNGREVDAPLLDDLMLNEVRSRVDQRDPRRGAKARRARSRILNGRTADGTRVTWDPERHRPMMGSRIVDLGEGRTQVQAGSEQEAARLLEKVRRRAAAEGKEAVVESEERRQVRPEITSTVGIKTDVWRRAAAKIALAVGAIVYPPQWRLSVDAERLREWMNGRDRTIDDGQAPPLLPTYERHPFALDDEHLLFFMQDDDAAIYLTVVLFGTLGLAVPVDTTGTNIPTQAWRLDWRAPHRDGATTFDDLVMAVVQHMTGAA